MSLPAATVRYVFGLGPGDAGPADADLLGRFIDRRDEAAFALLVRRHGDMVYGVCRRLLPTDQDAEDTFQATFLVLAEKAGTVTPRGAVGNWLYGVARRAALLARRSIARRRERMAELTDLPAPAPDPLAELRAALDDQMSRLADTLRTVIVLCDLEGRTRKEAAAILGWPEGTVAGRLTRARRLLAKRLARHAPAVSVAAVLSGTSARAPGAVLALTCHRAVPASVAALTRVVLAKMAGEKLMKTVIAVLMLGCAGLGMSLGAGQDKGNSPTPAPLGNAVAAVEKPANADPVFWGEEVDGLQAGLSLVETKTEQVGDTTRLEVKLEVKIRNVGKAPVEITYGDPWERWPKIADAAGKKVPAKIPDVLPPILLKRERVIEPGKTFSLSHPTVILEVDGKQPAAKHVTTPTARVRPGRYTISYGWVADSHEKLATGALGLVVHDPGESRRPDIGLRKAREITHGGPVGAVAFSADGSLLATCGGAVVRTWDPATGDSKDTLRGAANNCYCAVLPWGKGTWLVGKWDADGLELWDPAERRPGPMFAIPTLTDVTYAPRGPEAVLVLAAPDPSAGPYTVWDLKAGMRVSALAALKQPLGQAEFSGDGRRLVTYSSSDRATRVWDTATGEQMHRIGDADEATALAVSADGKRAVTQHRPLVLRVWDLGTGRETRKIDLSLPGVEHGPVRETGVRPGGRGLAITPDGRRLVALTTDRRAGGEVVTALRVIDLDTGEALAQADRTYTSLAQVDRSVTVSPDGRRAVTYSSVWDVPDRDARAVTIWELPPPDLTVDQAKKLLPEAAGIRNADFKALSADPRPEAVKSQSLSLVLLTLKPPATKNPEADKEFRLFEDKPRPVSDVLEAMWISKDEGYASFIQPKYLTDCTCTSTADRAEGVVTFKSDLFAGRIPFVARVGKDGWVITEFRLSQYKTKVVRGADGLWKQEALPSE